MASEELAALAAEFRNGNGSDRWETVAGVNGAVYARLLLSSPPIVLRDHTPAGLRARMAEFEKVYAETNVPSEARAAAQALETEG